jgi:3-(3-hydroxy-phenyl)propionate hydroxylase
MAEFRREHEVSIHGFAQANMFHQPDLEQLMLARVERHPLIDFRRGAEVCGLEDPPGVAPVKVRARFASDEAPRTLTGSFVLGCDGSNSTIRELLGVPMDDLGFTERWLVVDIRTDTPWTRGTAWNRYATPPGQPRSCRSPEIATAGSSSCARARTKPI